MLPDSRTAPWSGPLLRVARGEPTAAELAAVVVVVGALAGGGRPAAVSQPRRSRWAARENMMRPPVMAGPGAWRSSALPR